MQGSFAIGEHRFDVDKISPGLYIVPTPIGNLADITLRALRILAGADYIICEDSRVSAKLLRHYSIDRKCQRYHEHNAKRVREKCLQLLLTGHALALISDAGTPLISDPGFRLVAATVENDIPIIPLPGACAAIAALCASSLPTDRFKFMGFPPASKSTRRKSLAQFAGDPCTLVFYVSPHDLERFVSELVEIFGAQRPMVLAREMTKLYEQFVRLTGGEMKGWVAKQRVKGECVLLVGGNDSQPDKLPLDTLIARIRARMDHTPPSKLAKELAAEAAQSRREIYELILDMKRNDS